MSSRYSRFSSLPPGVLGDVCGEVILTVSDVIWTNGVDHPCCVCAKWWGEPGDGVLLWPAVTSEHGSTPAPDPEATTATYAVASGPEQLARYMSDMRVLVLDVFSAATDSPSRPPLGHAYLHLGLAHFETEFRERLAVYDAADAEVGKLDVSLVVRFAAAVGAQSLTAPEAAEWVGKTSWLACGDQDHVAPVCAARHPACEPNAIKVPSIDQRRSDPTSISVQYRHAGSNTAWVYSFLVGRAYDENMNRWTLYRSGTSAL